MGELRGVRLLRLPIAEHLVEQSTPLQRILNREVALFSTDDMAELYHRMLLQHAATFGRVLRLAAEAGAVPLLFRALSRSLRSARPALIAALDRLDQNHGGVDGYLTGAAGVPSRSLAQLRDRLLLP